MDALDAILGACDLVAVLGRNVRVRLLDISGSGCLLESEWRLPEGTTGRLRVSIDGTDYEDTVRIMRIRQRNGAGGGFHFGAEFLWTTSPGERSLRRVLTLVNPDRFTAARLGDLECM